MLNEGTRKIEQRIKLLIPRCQILVVESEVMHITCKQSNLGKWVFFRGSILHKQIISETNKRA